MFNRKAIRLPRFLSAAFAVPALVGAALIAAPSAFAAETETGPDGQELTVSETSLNPEGATVTVTGSGYREDVGVYVALCVVPDEGQAPGPCLGGVNMSGEEESSIWMSSNPPAYAEGLTVPFEEGGNFEVSLTVSADDGHTDCLDASVAPNGCAISTRADHTRENDRSADVLVPVTFDGAAEGADEGDDAQGATPEDEGEAAEGDSAEPSEAPTPTDEAPSSETGAESSDASDGVQNDDETESAGNSTAIAILIAVVVLGAVVGASAVAFANRKKRRAARAAALEGEGLDSDIAQNSDEKGDHDR